MCHSLVSCSVILFPSLLDVPKKCTGLWESLCLKLRFMASLCFCMSLLPPNLLSSGSDESMMIVHALLEVASHPEFDIASMTFNFWHNLQVYLIERYISCVQYHAFCVF